MLAVATKVSVEEFLALDDNFVDFHELHGGEIVEMAKPSKEHTDRQQVVEQQLGALCSSAGFKVFRELNYTLPNEVRRADVAMIETVRWRERRQEMLHEAPALVIEILSPSNKSMDLDHLREICFQHGTREFWILNIEFQTVMVYRPSRQVRLYGAGDSIPLDSFSVQASLSVDTLFALD